MSVNPLNLLSLRGHAVTADNRIEKVPIVQPSMGVLTLLFFYPADFTFVCPTELQELDKNLDEFEKRSVNVKAISVDTVYSHLAYKKLPVKKGGLGPVKFSLVSDTDHQISELLGLVNDKTNAELSGTTARATVLVDNQGKIIYRQENPLAVGRNIQELLRLIDAFRFTQNNPEVCPVNWQKGDKGIKV